MMKLISLIVLAGGLAASASAQTWSSNAPKIAPINQPEGLWIEAYPVSVNHCPTGLQPVVVGGEISCGIPVTGQTTTQTATQTAGTPES